MIANKTSIRNMTIVTAAMLASFAGTAAADSDPRLTVTFISDEAQGKIIDRQEYNRAVDKLENVDTGGIYGFFVANNLCISYLKVGDAKKAEQSCELAVERIQDELESNRHTRRHSSTGKEYEKFLAIALSNRGVTYVVNNKPDAARADFDAAIEIRSGLRQARTNLARLESLATSSA